MIILLLYWLLLADFMGTYYPSSPSVRHISKCWIYVGFLRGPNAVDT